MLQWLNQSPVRNAGGPYSEPAINIPNRNSNILENPYLEIKIIEEPTIIVPAKTSSPPIPSPPVGDVKHRGR